MIALAARWARRELRSGLAGFRIFFACLVLGVAAIADEVKVPVVAFADIGVSAVIVEDAVAVVQQFPMQSIEADAVVEPPVIAVQHMRKQVGLVPRWLPLFHLPRRIRHLRRSGRRRNEDRRQLQQV